MGDEDLQGAGMGEIGKQLLIGNRVLIGNRALLLVTRQVWSCIVRSGVYVPQFSVDVGVPRFFGSVSLEKFASLVEGREALVVWRGQREQNVTARHSQQQTEQQAEPQAEPQ